MATNKFKAFGNKSQGENFQPLRTDSSLWHDIPESTQAKVCGGANPKIRIKLKAFDHRLEGDSFITLSIWRDNSEKIC